LDATNVTINATAGTQEELFATRDAILTKIENGWISRTPRIPSDIVECIVPFCVRPPDASGTRWSSAHDLAQCCLVSRAWLIPARRALYRDIHWSHSGLDPFFLTLWNYTYLRHYVKVLGAVIDDTRWIGAATLLPVCKIRMECVLNSENIDLATKLLRELDGCVDLLKQVKILTLTDNLVNRSSKSILHSAHWNRVEELHLANIQHPFCTAPKAQAKVVFPLLHTVVLDDCKAIHLSTFALPLRHIELLYCENIDLADFTKLIHRHSDYLHHISVRYSRFSISQHNQTRRRILDDVALNARHLQELYFTYTRSYGSRHFLSQLSLATTKVFLSECEERISPEECQRFLERNGSLKVLILLGVTVGTKAEWFMVNKAAQRKGVRFSLLLRDTEGNGDIEAQVKMHGRFRFRHDANTQWKSRSPSTSTWPDRL
jgi:hypothetical protein